MARYLLERRALIIRRVRGKVRAARLPGTDADDLLATVLRRVDSAIRRGKVRTASEAEFWAYVHSVADNAARDALRQYRRERLALLECAVPPAALASRGPRSAAAVDNGICPAEEASRALRAAAALLTGPCDRLLLLLLRARGLPYAAIAAATGIGEQALRKRWSRLRVALRSGPDRRDRHVREAWGTRGPG